MKKVLISIMAAAVLLSFCACSSNPVSPYNVSDTSESQSSVAGSEQTDRIQADQAETGRASSDQPDPAETAADTEPAATEIDTQNNEQDTDLPDNSGASMELKTVGKLKYYLYIPSDPSNDMPLIVYLHGGTNKKAEVSALLTTDGFPMYLYEGFYGDLRAFVAVPKLEETYTGWVNVSDQIRDMIKSISTEYHINMSRIALTGHSMGGTGTYQLQTKLQNTFACIAPMSGSVKNTPENVTALAKTKIWAFVGTADTIVDPDSSRTIIGILTNQGADAKITELDGATHFDVPSLAYKDPQLIEWLVSCGETQ